MFGRRGGRLDRYRPPDEARMSIVQSAPPLLSARKEAIRSRSDAAEPERARWRRRAAFFHGEDLHYLKFLIPEGARVLEVGCCTGDLLAELKPSFGVGVDISAASIDVARRAYPNLSFYVDRKS